jgi:hypothetical protein
LEYLWKNSNDPNFREHATGLLSKTTLFDNAIKKGVIDTSDLIYFLSVIFLFLYATLTSVKSLKR